MNAPAIALLAGQYPVLSETFVTAEVAALRDLGHPIRVEAARSPRSANPEAPTGVPVALRQDDTRLRKAITTAWLVARAPRRCLKDVRLRAELGRHETAVPLWTLAPVAWRLRRARVTHLHAHFAHGAALDALRLARLLDLRWSMTAHAWDIYRDPRNLEVKLRAADFSTSGCDYTVRDLRRIAGPGAADRIHRVVMGVDPTRFRRTAPPPSGRTAVAVGRLVEKKGFTHLLDALALPDGAVVEHLVIVGDGPLREPLEEQARRLGIEQRVTFAGAQPPSAVRAHLEGAAVLVMPCVVAADGDRDSMPVVVKEALAMEVPVVASDEVGLPEVVRPPWGALATPGDAADLARALRTILGLTPQERAAAGAAGRAFVSEACDVASETARLASLVVAAQGQGGAARAASA